MEDLPQDSEAKVIRFICGAIIGFFATLVTFYRILPFTWDNPIVTWLCVAIGTFLAGYWAMKYGDYFWKHLIKRWWFW
ncbi:hypothetical protein [Neptuniibacter sp.]|uniref:hypothetical protein n=1 Tax=Neptuniibacter sp. TaxID=1962643 RepID=UPI002627C181|nr:hypothetical protein [Neptuniibacter sp.]MCP4596357.1 hypothetical protein [Neptuniibacter sp.]